MAANCERPAATIRQGTLPTFTGGKRMLVIGTRVVAPGTVSRQPPRPPGGIRMRSPDRITPPAASPL